jgi:hypothetical protein
MEGTEIAFAFRRLVVTWMSSNIGSWYIFGWTGLGKPLMISSTMSTLRGAMFVVLFIYDGRRLLDDGKNKNKNKLGLMIFIELDIITKEDRNDFKHVLVN